jgi:predicted RNA binding protein YcfA (HicA-like mRNA interferase family)
MESTAGAMAKPLRSFPEIRLKQGEPVILAARSDSWISITIIGGKNREGSRCLEVAASVWMGPRNQEGSHSQYVHGERPGKVTVAGHESDEVPPRTLKSILKPAGIDKR